MVKSHTSKLGPPLDLPYITTIFFFIFIQTNIHAWEYVWRLVEGREWIGEGEDMEIDIIVGM